ncbi:MAG: hypothetical protein KAJ33_01435 [Thermoplasmata archaeon]|nr:hypothetical protein [Thermoplasmata archaeon]
MAKEKWNYGMLEAAFESADMPSYEEYMKLIEMNLTEAGNFEPLFSGKISGKDEYWTFVRHRTEPKHTFDMCQGKMASVKSYSHCYSFKRFRGELMPKIMREKHKYMGLSNLPDAEEYDESELKELMKKIESSTPFHVAWISKTTRADENNTYFFLTGNVHPSDIEGHIRNINNRIKAIKSEIFLIQKFGHHKSHKRPVKEKESAIRDNVPEDFVDQDWLREYEYFNWNK